MIVLHCSYAICWFEVFSKLCGLENRRAVFVRFKTASRFSFFSPFSHLNVRLFSTVETQMGPEDILAKDGGRLAEVRDGARFDAPAEWERQPAQ